ncbi:MAG TPA: NADP oxidoreductase, partial [Bellilinea sp.]|nr:NADP oxidoreductase [Bellilinea sp.]
MITPRSFVLISSDPVSQQRGSGEIFAKFQELLKKYYLEQEVAINQIGDVGRHDALPIVIVYPEATIYGPVTPDKVETIVEEHLYKGRVVDSLVASSKELTGKIAWLSARKGTLPAEQRIVLRRAGRIDPTSLEDYIVNDGYQSIAKVLAEMTPQGVIDELKKSNLRGRGGAGFPTATKWGFVGKEPKGKKYVVCNADESEPGTFKDRLILEGDPHSIIEAMLIAGYAVGADAGYIYIRGEYTLALQRLQNAIAQAKEIGMLGEDILGSSFNFELHLHSGAGAYICGEETALLESIEGNRGQPRTRPPFPTTSGLWGKPTLINNVETLANVPPILLFGADWFKKFGTPSSPGTKVYTILGNVNVTGLIEVPMGITLREVIAFYAQGMKLGHTFKMAQTGGSSGSI